jgi:general secretion pathway protein I
MIAVAVIAIALVTLIGSQSQSVSLITGARFETMASLLAQWKMTDLMQRDPEQLALDSGNFGDDYPHFSWRVEVSELSENETGLPAVAGVLKRLDLTVANEQDSRLTYTLRTLVYKRPPPEKKAAETDDQDAGPRTTTPGATGGQR